MKPHQAIDRVRDVIRRQHKALSTEENIRLLAPPLHLCSEGMRGELSSDKKLERFLTDLARRHDVSASSQNQASNAILYFYKYVLNQTIAGT